MSDADVHRFAQICTTHVQQLAGRQGTTLISRHGGTEVRWGGRRRVGASEAAEPLPLWLRGATTIYPRAGSSTYDVVLHDDELRWLRRTECVAPQSPGVSRRIALRMGVLRLAASCILRLRVCRSAWI